MGKIVPIHYLMMAAGEYLKAARTVTPYNVQSMTALDVNFQMRPPMNECASALQLLEMAGFIMRLPGEAEVYKRVTSEPEKTWTTLIQD